MEIQKLLLPAGESSHIDKLGRLNAHSLERGTVSNGGNYELAVVLEADKATIEEMINARG